MADTVWTDYADNRLRYLWGKGYTASQIAMMMGLVSRNAVIGRARRIGLAARASPINGERRPPSVRKPKVAVKPRPAPTPKPKPVPKPVPRRRDPAPIPAEPPPSGLAPPAFPPKGACHWITGDVQDGTARWCSQPVTTQPKSILHRNYCPHHAARATVPLKPRNTA